MAERSLLFGRAKSGRSTCFSMSLTLASGGRDIMLWQVDALWQVVIRNGYADGRAERACPGFPAPRHHDRLGRTISEFATARVSRSGPKSLALSIERISASRLLARLTRLLIVPTAHPQIWAASS
jgi:hypothetical protein